MSHIQKVCFFTGSPVSWLTSAVRHVAKGLKKCQGNSFEFPNFILIELLLRIIRRETVVSEFAQACWASFLFAFRVPSETPQLVRAYRGDEICAFSPRKEKALIWIGSTPDGCFLVTKFKWRKNITGGCVLRHPCFCTGDRPAARARCPAHVPWQPYANALHPGHRYSRRSTSGISTEPYGQSCPGFGFPLEIATVPADSASEQRRN